MADKIRSRAKIPVDGVDHEESKEETYIKPTTPQQPAQAQPQTPQANPMMGNPMAGNPMMGNPMMGNPMMGNPMGGMPTGRMGNAEQMKQGMEQLNNMSDD